MIAGLVVNSAGSPLAGATDTVVGGASAVTNSTGYYYIPVAAGKYLVNFCYMNP